jgi:hypothetical protein
MRVANQLIATFDDFLTLAQFQIPHTFKHNNKMQEGTQITYFSLTRWDRVVLKKKVGKPRKPIVANPVVIQNEYFSTENVELYLYTGLLHICVSKTL